MNMKATDLRVNNLLYFKNTKDIAKVSLIHDKHFDCRDEYGNFIPNGNYEPIELTEEWLLKMGLKKTTIPYDKYGFSNLEIKPDLDIYTIRDFAIDCDFDIISPNLSGFLFKEIKYVHQLQNLYHALTGEELTIK